MTLPILEYHTPSGRAARSPFSVLERCVHAALGIALPIICFAVSADRYPAVPEWQTGNWNRYLLFIPDGRAGHAFYPLLSFSMIALACFIVHPRSSQRLLVRLGIYTGVILSLQYSFIQATVFNEGWMVALPVGLASNFILLGVVKLIDRIPRRVLGFFALASAGVVILFVIAAVAGGGILGDWARSAFVVAPAAGLLMVIFAPAWCAGVYVRASLLSRRFRDQTAVQTGPLSSGVAWLAWAIGYFAAWKWSIANAVALYAALPKAQPGCYVATAAACGHKRFVGSEPVRAADGSTFHANRQLRRLKCAEIALRETCPALHRRARQFYDRAGPVLARWIKRKPLRADFAFALLKPVEWFAFGLLRLAVPQAARKSDTIYSEQS